MASAEDLKRKIDLHEALKEWFMEELRKEGIECEETDFYSPKGDIFIKNESDVPKAKKIAKKLNEKYSR